MTKRAVEGQDEPEAMDTIDTYEYAIVAMPSSLHAEITRQGYARASQGWRENRFQYPPPFTSCS
jgi:hypothetical protein